MFAKTTALSYISTRQSAHVGAHMIGVDFFRIAKSKNDAASRYADE